MLMFVAMLLFGLLLFLLLVVVFQKLVSLVVHCCSILEYSSAEETGLVLQEEEKVQK